jgi:hypothetical protein
MRACVLGTLNPAAPRRAGASVLEVLAHQRHQALVRQVAGGRDIRLEGA